MQSIQINLEKGKRTMTKEKTMTVRPYDHDVADDIFSILFYGSDIETEEGLRELPAASYQLVISALELIRYEAHSEERNAVRQTISLCEYLRDVQKQREYKRSKAHA